MVRAVLLLALHPFDIHQGDKVAPITTTRQPYFCNPAARGMCQTGMPCWRYLFDPVERSFATLQGLNEHI
jgi:hypothetical protein